MAQRCLISAQSLFSTILYERVAHKVAGAAFKNVVGTLKSTLAEDFADKSIAYRVLDVASGVAREPAATVARTIPRAEVLATDVLSLPAESLSAPPNLSIGVENAEELAGIEDASIDAVTCCFGLEHVTDPVAALQSFHRVLRPGGLVVLVTWGPVEDVAWFAPLATAANELGTNLCDPLLPVSTPALTEEFFKLHLGNSGFGNVETAEEDLLAYFASSSEWYEAVVMGGPWEDFCVQWELNEAELRARFVEAAQPFEGTSGGVMCSSAVRVTSAVKRTGKVVRKPPGGAGG